MTYLQIFQDKRELVEQFPDADKGILLTAMMAYAFDGEEIDFGSSPAKYVWPVFREMINASKAKCETNKANASKGKRSEAKQSESERTEANESEAEATVSEPVANRYINQESRINNQESIIINTTTTNARANATAYVSLHIPAMTAGNWEEFRDYQCHLPDDLICRAVDSAGSEGVLKWAYVSKILNRYVTSGIKSVEQAEAAETARQASRQKVESAKATKPKKVVTEMQYNQRSYDDDENKLPAWMAEALAAENAQASKVVS